MKILGIETSCDETGVCIIETRESAKGPALAVLSNQLYSQVAKHKEFGGVFPMLAKREHAINLVPLFKKCLEEAGLTRNLKSKIINTKIKTVKEILEREPGLFAELEELLQTVEKPEVDAIAVTNGPGLEPALWVGVTFAKALGEAWDLPLIPTNHMEGHIIVASLERIKEGTAEFLIKKIKYPALALLISGGHTQLVLTKDPLKYEIIGNTRDDAVGEAYDKVARMLGLSYPGGKIISELAQKEQQENPDKKSPYPLPRPMIHSKDLNFSFSGLKTAVLYTLKKIPALTDKIKQEVALEFENAILDVLGQKTEQAIEKYNPETLIIGGGVSANLEIRKVLEKLCQKYQIDFLVPEVSASTDNALMIATTGYVNILAGQKSSTDFRANGNLSL